ncbi:MAG: exodeoxyribonuclease VII small subunit [Candidatus Limiplasma sp.]|nr:exodeoxyribonuclease VII small subunit [Clostridiales bacterium]MDY3243450.1 exodeoxyribonuclease VII small subunit [Candidatus Limiplasma sp.]
MPARTVKKAPSFEEELQKLETMADQMEQSQLPLEELMKLYEQGVALTAELKKRLEGMQATLKEIRVGAAEEATEQPMEGQISMSELEGSSRA